MVVNGSVIKKHTCLDVHKATLNAFRFMIIREEKNIARIVYLNFLMYLEFRFDFMV